MFLNSLPQQSFAIADVATIAAHGFAIDVWAAAAASIQTETNTNKQNYLIITRRRSMNFIETHFIMAMHGI